MTYLEVSAYCEYPKGSEGELLLYLVLCRHMCVLWIPESLSGKKRVGGQKPLARAAREMLTQPCSLTSFLQPCSPADCWRLWRSWNVPELDCAPEPRPCWVFHPCLPRLSGNTQPAVWPKRAWGVRPRWEMYFSNKEQRPLR